MNLTSLQADRFLELILPANSRGLYRVQTSLFFLEMGIEPTGDRLEAQDLWLRRRAIRRTAYLGPVTLESRSSRSCQPLSWVESRILDWVRNSDRGKKTAVDVSYVSTLLQRTEDQIIVFLNHSQVKLGIVGFDLQWHE